MQHVIAGPISSRSRRAWISPVVLSFIIYAAVLFLLPQNRDAPFAIDRSSIASAVSNAVYGVPFGTVYSGVLEHFLLRVEAPLQTIFDEITPGKAPPGYVMKTIHDGNGSGYIVVATIALRVFGLYSWSLPLLMLGFMGFSAFALLARFGGHAADVVILYFCGLTVMLFTALVWNPANSLQMSVGCSRYFTLVAILPAFHLLFEIMEGSRRSRRNHLLLGAQTVMLVLSVLVRSSAAPTVGVIGLVWLLLLWRRRHEAGEMWLLTRQGVIIALAGVGFLGLVLLSLPFDYVNEGRLTKTFWELIVVSLGTNPAWPFSDLREIFDCGRFIPEGLVSNISDRNGHCIWWDYATKHQITVNDAVDGVYGGRYETAMREAFFKIARCYPGEVLKTFFYYKPKMIVSSIFSGIQMNLSVFPLSAIGLLVGALVNFVINFIAAPRLPIPNRMHIAKGALLFAVSTIPSYLVAWANPWTTGDLLFCCIFCTGLLLGVVVATGSRA